MKNTIRLLSIIIMLALLAGCAPAPTPAPTPPPVAAPIARPAIEAPAPAPISAKGKHVVVIGGGDTGSDCVGTSNRHGAASVTQFELMPMPPEQENKALTWPYWPTKLRTSSSHEEGCERDFAVATKEFIGKNGKVKALKACRLEFKDGKMSEVAGSELS